MQEQRQFLRHPLPSDNAEFMYSIQSQIRYRLKPLLPVFNRVEAVGAVKNVSAEGLCFISDRKLKRGDRLEIEVCLPGTKEIVRMEGEARWSSISDGGKYDTGVHLLTVGGKRVRSTVHFDPAYHVHWSLVLESVLGRFRIIKQQEKNPH